MRFLTATTNRARRTTETPSPGGIRMTGRDERIGRNPEIVAWLAKVYGEITNESRPWPEFHAKRLGAFLQSRGVDLGRAVKDHGDSLKDIPESIRAIEGCIPALKGASFLSTSADAACFKIRRRYETATR
jgi:hypothetical protein